MMKKLNINILLVVLSFAAFCFAAELDRPEFTAPTPAEKQELSKESADLSDKDKEDWKKLREERREAREQILSELRQNKGQAKKLNREKMNPEEKPKYRNDGPTKEKKEHPNKGKNK